DGTVQTAPASDGSDANVGHLQLAALVPATLQGTATLLAVNTFSIATLPKSLIFTDGITVSAGETPNKWFWGVDYTLSIFSETGKKADPNMFGVFFGEIVKWVKKDGALWKKIGKNTQTKWQVATKDPYHDYNGPSILADQPKDRAIAIFRSL